MGLRKIPGAAWRRMDGGVCLGRWETSKEAAARSRGEMRPTERGRGGEEPSMASQSAPEFRLGHDEGRGLAGHPEGGAQEAVGSIGLNLGEKPGLETKLVWGITVEWCWKASGCG